MKRLIVLLVCFFALGGQAARSQNVFGALNTDNNWSGDQNFRIANNIRYADQFSGDDAGEKIAAAIADLPSTGGIVDARGLEGAQTCTGDVFSGVTKPVTLFLGACTCTLSATWGLQTDGIQIIGLGPGVTTLKVGNSQNTAAIVASKTSGTVTVNNIRVANLTVDGNRANNTTAYHGLFFQYVTHGWIENVEVHSSEDGGIDVGNGAVAGPTSTDIEIRGSWSHDNDGNGFDVNNSTDVRVIGNRASGNGLAGAGAAGFFTGHGTTSNIKFIGNTSTANNGPGYMATSGAGDTSTKVLFFSENASLSNVAATGYTGEAFLLNQGGGGVMDGPYVLVNNIANGNAANSIVTGGTVTNINDFNNNFDGTGVVNVTNPGMLFGDNAPATFNNNLARLKFKDSGGTARDVIWADGANYLDIKSPNTATGVRFLSSADAAILTVNDNTDSVDTIGQIVSTLATGTAPFSITSTTPVANLTSVPTTYNKSGTQQTATHLVQDTCTLGTDCAVTLTNAAVFTSSTSYTCVCEDDSAIAACRVDQSSGSAFTITGTGTDAIRYICLGN